MKIFLYIVQYIKLSKMLITNEAAQVHALQKLSDKLDNLNLTEEISGIKMDAESFEKIINAITNNNNNNNPDDPEASDYIMQ